MRLECAHDSPSLSYAKVIAMRLTHWTNFIKRRLQPRRSRGSSRLASALLGRSCMAEALEQRLVLSAVPAGAHGIYLLQPGQDPSTVNFEDTAPANTPAGTSAFQLDDNNRWDASFTNGSGLVQGQPTTLRWGILTDGADADGGTSNLIQFMDNIHGDGGIADTGDLTQKPWFFVFNNAFNRLGELSGLTYSYLAINSASTSTYSVPDSSTSSATTPEIIIGGTSIDGASNVLAYNYFPNDGDMVIDTDDTSFFSGSSNTYRGSRNVIMHEAGHGIGIDHVESNNAAFLMEPFVSTSFDGPQFDDILALQRGYGDVLEKSGGNDTSGTATNLGTISFGSTVSKGTKGTTTTVASTDTDFVSIDDDSDPDFFKFTTTGAGTATITLTPQGPTYNQGPQNGTQTSFNASQQSDLTLQVIDTNGTTVLSTSNTGGVGVTETISGLSLPSAGTYFIKVTGAANAVQIYRLDATVASVTTSSATLDGSNNLVITDDTGVADTYTIHSDTTNSRYVISNTASTINTVISGATGSGTNSITIPFAQVTGSSITINGGTGADALTVNFSLGNFSKAITFNGGNPTSSPGDSLTLTGGSTFSTVTHTATNASDGTVSVTGNSTITYTGLEPVTDNLSATDRVFTFTGGAETITLTDATGANMTIDSTLSESITFANPTGSLTINAGTGDDTVTVTSVDAAYNVDLTINGDAGVDTVNLNADITFAANEFLAVNADSVATGAGADLITSGTGTITVAADDVALNGTSSLVSASTVTLRPETAARAINLGTETAGQLSLTDAELDRITATSRIVVGHASAGAVTFSSAIAMANSSVLEVISGSTINDGGSSDIFTDTSLALNAASGIGTTSTLNVAVSNFSATAATGGIDVTNSGSVTLTTVGGVTGLATTTSGNVSLAATGSITVAQPVSVVSNGTLLLDAQSGDAGDIIVNSSITTASGSFTLRADDDISSNSSGTLATTSGLLTVTADDDATSTGNITYVANINHGSAGSVWSLSETSGTISGVISGSGGFTKSGTGTLSFTGSSSNTYFGSTTINAGILSFAKTGGVNAIVTGPINVGDGTGTDTLQLASSNQIPDSVDVVTATGGVVDLNGQSDTIDALTGTGTVTSSAVGTSTLTVGGGNETVASFSGVIQNGSGTVGLTKTGSGTQTLFGTNTYTGQTTVSAGTLSVTGSTAAGSSVVVMNGGTLGGTGSVNGSVSTQSGGTIAPGMSPGVLNTGSVTLVSGSTLSIELVGDSGAGVANGHDQLNVTGTVSLGSATLSLVTVGLTAAEVPNNQTFTIINNDGTDAVSGTFSGLAEGATINSDIAGSGRALVISYVGGTGNDVVLKVIQMETSITLDGSNNLVITDSNGGSSNDTLTIQSDTTNSRFVIADPNNVLSTSISGATGNGSGTVTIPFASVAGSQILVNTLAGNDSLTLDLSLGDFAKTITYDGGTQTTSDSLTVTGGVRTFTTVTHTATSASAGTIDVTGNSTISYSGLEPVTDNLSASNRVFAFTGGAETITVTDGTAADGKTTIDSTLSESITFANPTGSLTINAGTSDDTITITSVDAGYNVDLTINGDAGTDTVNLNADITFASGENLVVNAESVNTGTNADLTTSGAGAIAITADDVAIDTTSTLTSASTVTLKPQTAGRQIDLGNETSGKLSFVNSELDRIAASRVVIGDASAGEITFTSPTAISLALSDTLHLVSGGLIGSNIGDVSVFEDTNLVVQGSGGVSLITKVTNIAGTADSNISLTNQQTPFNVASIAGVDGISTNIGNLNLFNTASGGAIALNAPIFNGLGPIGIHSTELSSTASGTITAISGLITINAAMTVSPLIGAVNQNSSGSYWFQPGTVQSVISGNGSLSLNTTSSTPLTLSGANTYSGPTLIERGTLQLSGGSNRLPTTTSVTLGTGSNSGTLDLNNQSQTIAKLLTSGTGTNRVVDSTNDGTVPVLTINIASGTNTYSGILGDTNKDGFGLTKTGAGTLALSGTNTYTGATSVSAGTLSVTGSTASGSAVTVQSGATLNGTGTVAGTVNVQSGGKLTPGLSPGILNTGSVTLTSGATLPIEIGGTTAGNTSSNHDQLNVTGSVTLGNATLTLSAFNGFAPAIGQSFTIINNDDSEAINGTFNGLAEGASIPNFLGSSLTASISYVGGTGNDVVLSLADAVSVAVSPSTVTENGATNLDYTFTRGSSIGSLTVSFNVTGTGTFSTDYTQSGAATFTAASGTLTFNDGSTTATVTIDPTSDSTVELNETVILTLTSGSGYTVGSPSAATGTITNDDNAVISLTANSASEGGNITYTAAITNAVDVDVTVTFNTLGTGTATSGSDFTAVTNQTVTFTAGSATSQTVDAVTLDDTLVEGSQTVVGQINGLSATSRSVTLTGGGASATATGTILDADTATVAFQSSSSTAGEDAGAHAVTLVLTTTGGNTLESAATFSISATNSDAENADYDSGSFPKTVTFNAGSANATTSTVNITPTSDTLVEGSESVTLTAAVATGAATLGAQTTHAVTITDADAATIAFQSASASFAEDGGSKSVTIVLTAGAGNTLEANAVLSLTATNGSAENADYNSGSFPQAVTFNAGSGNSATQSITFTPASDTLIEGNETVSLSLAIFSGVATLGAQSTETLTITDSDAATIAFQSASTTAGEDTGSHNVTVILTTVPGNTLENTNVIDISAANINAESSDYNFSSFPQTLTFAAGSGNATSQSAMVTLNSDTFVEGTESFTLTAAVSSGPATVGTQSTHTFNITDADTATVAFQTTSSSAGEDAGTHSVTLVLSTASGNTLENAATFSIGATNGTAENADYDSGSFLKTVTFNVGSGDTATSTVSITLASDTLVEGTETVTLTATVSTGAATLGAQTTHVVSITDADTATVAFQSATSTLAEDSGAQTINLVLTTAAGNTLENAATFSIAATNGNAENADYDSGAFPKTVTFNSGSGNSATSAVSIVTTADTLVEGTESLTLTATVTTGVATLGAQTTNAVSITDADTATVAFQSGTSNAGEDDGVHNVVLVLTTTPGNTLEADAVFNINATNGSGTSNSDYDNGAFPKTVTFAAGSGNAVTQNTTLTPTSDSLIEGPETVTLTATVSTGAATVGSPSSHVVTILDADAPSVQFLLTSSSAGEDAGAHSVTLILSTVGGSTLSMDTTFDINVTNVSSENADYDFGAFPKTVTFVSGSADGATQTVELTPASDTLVEGNETLTLTVTLNNGVSNIGTQNTHTVTINDADSASVQFQSAASSTGEDGGAKSVVLVLTTAAGNTLENAATFSISATNGSAENADYDFGSFPKSVTFASGSGNAASQSTSLTPTSDTLIEGDETVTLTASVASGAATIGTQTTHVVTITDADTATVAFQSASSATGEDAGAKNVVLVLTTTPGNTLEDAATFSISATNGSAENTDYDSGAFPKTVTFNAGSGNAATSNVSITPASDTLVDGDETVTLTATLNSGVATVGSQKTHVVTITDADSATVAFQSASSSVGEDSGAHSVTIVLTTAAGNTLENDAVLSITATNGTAENADYDNGAFPKTITFSSGSGNAATHAVDITPSSDTLVEGNETVTLTNTVSSGVATVGTQATHVVTITDADTATIAFQSATSTAGEDSGAHSVTLVLSTAAGNTLENNAVFSITATNGTAENADYDNGSFPKTVTFAAGSGNTDTQSTSIVPSSDTLVEGDESVTLTALASSGAATVSGQSTHAVTITDADSASVAFQTASTTTGEDAGSKNIVLVLTTTGGSTLENTATFSISATNGNAENADYDNGSFPKTVTFNAGSGNAATSNTTVVPTSDQLVEGNESLTLTASVSTGVATLGTQSTHTVTISDADTATVSFQSATNTVSEDGGSQNITLVLTTAAGNTLENSATFDISAANISASNADYDNSAFPKTVTFNAGSGNATSKTVAIVPTSDTLIEGSESLTLAAAASTGAATVGTTSSSTVTITDADTATIAFQAASSSAGEDAGAHSVTLVLTTAAGNTLASNAVFSITPTNGTAENADYDNGSFPKTVTFVASSGNSTTQTVDLVSSADTLIEGNETVTLTATASSGAATVGTQSTYVVTITDADTATVAFQSATTTTGEDAGSKNITLVLTTSAGNTLENAATFSISAANGTAETADYDNASFPKTVTFNAGSGNSSTGNVAIIPVSDTLIEGDETVTLTATVASGAATVGTQSTNIVTITDADAASIAFQSATSTLTEDGGSQTLNLVLTTTDGNTLENAAVFSISATSGTASNADYDNASFLKTVTFNAGSGNSTSKTVAVVPTSDTLVEGSETLTLTASVSSGAATVGAQSTNAVTITDADTATVSFQSSTSLIDEGAGATNIVLVLTTGAGNTLVNDAVFSVSATNVSTANGDYNAADFPTSITFTAGSGNASTKNVAVTPVDDSDAEGFESLQLSLLATSGQVTVGSSSSHTVTIVDNDAPNNVYVDDDWAALANGVDPDGAGPATAIGYDAFATIQGGVNAVATSGTVNVYAGPYVENVTINKDLTLDGVTGKATSPEADQIILDPASGDGITISAPATAVVISDITVTGAVNGIVASGSSGLTLTNVQSTNHSTTGLASTATGNLVLNGGTYDGLNVSGANSITIGTSNLTATDTVALSAQNTVGMSGSLNAGSSTVSIAANADNTGAQTFTMGTGTSIVTTNDTANAIVITVNSLGSGGGNAILQTLTAGTTAGSTGGRITVDANDGAIVDGNSGSNNITAGNAQLRGLAGVGTSGDPIDTNVTRLEGVGGTGGFFVTNSSALTIGGLSAVIGITTSSGNINVQATSLTVSENVSATTTGHVTLVTPETGASNDLMLSAGVTVSSTGGNINLLSGDNITTTATSILSAGLALALTGDSGDNDAAGATFNIASQLVSTTGTTLTGSNDNDAYNITYPTGATNSGTISISDAGGSDAVVVNGTSSADTFFFTAAGKLTRGTTTAEPIQLNASVDSFRLNTLEGNDTISLEPNTLFPVTIDGGLPIVGNPGVPPGDTLTIDALGGTIAFVDSTSLRVTNGATVSTLITPISIETGNYSGAEPLFPSQRYDFNARFVSGDAYVQTPTQPGFIGMTSDTVYTTALGYGWNVPLISTSGSTNTAATAALVNDAHVYTSGSVIDFPTFIANVENTTYQVTVILGHPTLAMDGVRIRNADTGDFILENLSTNIGESLHRTFNVTVTDGTLNLRFEDVFNSRMIAINGIDIRTPQPNAFGIVAGMTTGLEADGSSIDNFSIGGGPSNGLLTLAPSLGTLVGTDADPNMQGFQIATNGSGQGSVQIQRPFISGTSTLTITSPTGEGTGTPTISYAAPTPASIAKRYDFNTLAATTQAGYIGILATTIYTAGVGHGWLAQPRSYSLSTPLTGSFADLINDGHRSSTAGTFRVDLANGLYDVHVSMGDNADHSGLSITANGATALNNITLTRHQIFERSFQVNVTSGQLDLTFNTGSTVFDPAWALNGLEIRAIATVGTITPTNIGSVPANGSTVTTITSASTLPVGTPVTVNSTLGTITSTDANSNIAGVQVLVGTGGTISFNLQSPTAAGTPTVEWRAIDGSARQVTTNATFLTFAAGTGASSARRFDFNRGSTDATMSPTAAGFTGVRSNHNSPAADGFGWLTLPSAFNSVPTSGVTTIDLYRDGHRGATGTSNTFRVQASTATTYDVRVYVGQFGQTLDQVRIVAEGASTSTAPSTNWDQFTTVTINGVTDTNADGFVDFTFSDGGGSATGWAVVGLDIATTGNLPGSTPLLASIVVDQSQAAPITLAEAAPVIALAKTFWQSTGLTAAQSSALNSATIRIADLNAQSALGLADPTNNSIVLDDNGAGLGWHLGTDPTEVAPITGNNYDLLSAAIHELGHLIGRDHDTDLMRDTLHPAERLSAIDSFFAECP